VAAILVLDFAFNIMTTTFVDHFSKKIDLDFRRTFTSGRLAIGTPVSRHCFALPFFVIFKLLVLDDLALFVKRDLVFLVIERGEIEQHFATIFWVIKSETKKYNKKLFFNVVLTILVVYFVLYILNSLFFRLF